MNEKQKWEQRLVTSNVSSMIWLRAENRIATSNKNAVNYTLEIEIDRESELKLHFWYSRMKFTNGEYPNDRGMQSNWLRHASTLFAFLFSFFFSSFTAQFSCWCFVVVCSFHLIHICNLLNDFKWISFIQPVKSTSNLQAWISKVLIYESPIELIRKSTASGV